MSAYLDASVLMPLVVDEATTGAVQAFVGSNKEPFLISDFAVAEVASATSRLVRMKILTAADAYAGLSDFDHWRAGAARNVEFIPADVRVADSFVRRFELKLRAPDALHLAICRREGLALTTLDKRLLAAAAELNIPAHAP